MSKNKASKKIKFLIIILLFIATTGLFFLYKNVLINKNTEKKQVQETQNKNSDSIDKNKSGEQNTYLVNQDNSNLENKLEEKKKVQIKTNERRLNEKSKKSLYQWKNDVIELSRKYSDKVIIKGKDDKKVVALTFDDGPDRSITSKIIDELNRNNIKATFFFEGDRMENNLEVVKKAYKNGNQIAGHSYSHPMFTKKSKEQVINEMTKTNNLINSAIGKTPIFFRPPYGDIDEKTLKYFDNGDRMIIWSLDTFDWVQGTKGSEIAGFVIDSIEPGDIVLMHSSSGKQETLKAVPLIINGLKEKGYEFVTVSELLGENAYK